MGAITTLEQFHREMREFDRTYGPEDYYDRRLREKREEEERKRETEKRERQAREARAQQQLPAQSPAERKDWDPWCIDIVERYLQAN